MGRIWASLLLVSLPFVLFLAFANVLTTNPYLSLGLLFGLQFALWVIVGFTEDDVEAITNLYYLSPGWLKFQLMAEEASVWRSAALHQVLFALGFGGLGHLAFRRRDL